MAVSPLRIAGAFFWLGCGWCAGDAACQQIRRHLDALEETLLVLQYVRQEIGYRHTELDRLFRHLAREGKLAGQSFRSLCPPEGLTGPEKACYTECFSALGLTEAEQECRRLELYEARFTDLLQRAKEEAGPRLELSRKLGLAAGLAAAILFL